MLLSLMHLVVRIQSLHELLEPLPPRRPIVEQLCHMQLLEFPLEISPPIFCCHLRPKIVLVM